MLYSLIKLNDDIHGWFAVYSGLRKKEPDGWFRLSDSQIFEAVEKMRDGELYEAFRDASIHVVMSGQSSADVRHKIGQYFGIDLAAEFEITEEYCQKKTVRELLDIGDKLDIFDDPKAEAFLFEKLLKKRKNFKACKKGELVRVFMESGIDLKGKVPDEILKGVPIKKPVNATATEIPVNIVGSSGRKTITRYEPQRPDFFRQLLELKTKAESAGEEFPHGTLMAISAQMENLKNGAGEIGTFIAIIDEAEEELQKIKGDCSQCQYHRAMSNKKKGVKIPGGYGKCIRPEGHCSPEKVNEGL